MRQYLVIFCAVIAISAKVDAMNPNAEAAYRKLISQVEAEPNQENYALLIDGLATCGKYKKDNDPINVSVYNDLQKAAIAMPNHAQFFLDQIETERSKFPPGENPAGKSNNYNVLRFRIIRETMEHLPSPEIVAALGKLLYDERDTPPPPLPGQDWMSTAANAYLASETLTKLHIRNAPVTKKSLQPEADLATWRLWWEQVQNGTRTFSFEGQDVAYRLTKHGKYETMSITEGLNVNHQLRVDTPRAVLEAEQSGLSKQSWAIIVIFILLLLGLYVVKWKKSHA